jgi:hypothetical protein
VNSQWDSTIDEPIDYRDLSKKFVSSSLMVNGGNLVCASFKRFTCSSSGRFMPYWMFSAISIDLMIVWQKRKSNPKEEMTMKCITCYFYLFILFFPARFE